MHRNDQPRIGRLEYPVRHPGRFSAEQENAVLPVVMIEIGDGPARGEQGEPQSEVSPPRIECRPGGVSGNFHPIEIIQSGPPEGPVGDREPGRLDQMGLDAQTGAEPQNRSGILRDIRLVERNCEWVSVVKIQASR